LILKLRFGDSALGLKQTAPPARSPLLFFWSWLDDRRLSPKRHQYGATRPPAEARLDSTLRRFRR